MSTISTGRLSAQSNDKDIKLKDLYKKIADDSSGSGLILSYMIDKEKDRLQLAWNAEYGKEKFYVFRKLKTETKFKLISDKDGITDNFLTLTLTDNIGANFIVCRTPEIPKLPDDVKIFSTKDMGDMAGEFKKLRKSEDKESNIVVININPDNINKNNKLVMLSNKDKVDPLKQPDINNIKKNSKDEKKINSDVKNKLDKVKEEVKNTTSVALNSKDEKKPDGFFTLNNDSDTKIEYKGVTLEIPQGAANADSYIFIKPLKKDELVATSPLSPNITYIDQTGSYAGYDITLNGDSSNKFNKDISISMKYSADKIPAYAGKESAFVYYFDEKIWGMEISKKRKTRKRE